MLRSGRCVARDLLHEGASFTMKTLLVLMAMLVAVTSYAQTKVRVAGLTEGPDPAPVLHVWGGQPVELALEVTATEASHKASVRATVYQLAGAIAAPVGQSIPVVQEVVFAHSLAHFESWKLTLPGVRHPTSFEVRFAAQAEGNGAWKPAGSARVVAYPADLGAQLKEMVAAAQTNGAGRIAVFGTSAELKAALQSISIPFADAGEAPPDELDPALVYLGQGNAREIESIAAQVRSPGRLMIFTQDPERLPGVYRTDSRGGFVMKVTLPLLPNFAHSPQNQNALFALLRDALQIAKTDP